MNYDEEPLYSEEGFSPFTHSDRNHGNNDRNQAHMTMPPPLNRHRNRPPFLRCALIVGLAAVVIALASAGVAVYMTGDCPDQLACVSVEPLACPSPAALAQASEPAKVYEDTHEHNIPACNNSDVCLSKDCVVGAADVLRDIDHNIDPCDDFFEYTCGNYKAANAIPDDRSTVSRFSDLFDANAQVLRSILETPGETAPATELEMTIDLAHKYYQSCMDVDTLEAVSSEGLIAQWRPIIQYDLKQSTLTQTVAELTLSGIRHFFKVEVFSDFKEATRNALYLGQASGLLPDPSYYAMDNHRDAYVSFIVQLFELTGISGTSDMEQNALKAKELFDFEKSLADIQVPPVELRDPIAIYNPMPISDIPASAAFDFAAFFDALNLPAPVDKVIVLVPVYFEKLEAILGAADPKILSMYMKLRVVIGNIRSLALKVREAYNTFSKEVNGSDLSKRWLYCVSHTDNSFDFVSGRMFIDAKFGMDAKEKADQMVTHILATFEENFDELPWMDDATREKARAKIGLISRKIAYPTEITNDSAVIEEYEGLEIAHDTFMANQIALRIRGLRKMLDDFAQPVDKTRWAMTAATVNAYYDPSVNEIVFPAGILQPPFYSASYPLSMNYGGIGAVIGHEVSHGFDDEGSQYDGTGNLENWWQNETETSFNELTQCFVNQYSEYTVLGKDGKELFVNGNLTLGENMADNGGLSSVVQAYDHYVDRNGEEPAMPGTDLTHKQLLFVNFARVWCGKGRPEANEQQVLRDPHSPPQHRVLGTLANMKEFAEAFNCPVGSRMNPDRQRCKVW